MNDVPDLFDGLPDAPKQPEIGGKFLAAVGAAVTQAGDAMRERTRQAELDAEREAEEVARQAELDAAEQARGEADPLAVASGEGEIEAEADNVIQWRAPAPPTTRPRRERKNDGRGKFFAIDHRLWRKVCGLGMEAAIAYLVIASGTGGDQRTSSWSVNSIERRFNISRGRANKAILALRLSGLIDKSGTPRRPQYYIQPLSKVGGQKALPAEEEKLLSSFRGLKSDGFEPVQDVPETAPKALWMGLTKPRQVAFALVKRGLLDHITEGWFQLSKRGAIGDDEGDWTWLPNLLVDPMNGADAPLERIRQSSFVPALQLFVDMYHMHDLKEGKGVAWRAGEGLRTVFERHKVGEHSLYVVWGFKAVHTRFWPDGALALPIKQDHPRDYTQAFWKALKILQDAGLVSDVPHLIESNDYADPDVKGDAPAHFSPNGAIIHPLPRGNGRGFPHPEEEAVADAARRASQAMVSPGQWEAALEKGLQLFAPIKASIPDVSLVGVYRLRHAPITAATREWSADAEEWRAFAEGYDLLASGQAPGKSAISRGDQG